MCRLPHRGGDWSRARRSSSSSSTEWLANGADLLAGGVDGGDQQRSPDSGDEILLHADRAGLHIAGLLLAPSPAQAKTTWVGTPPDRFRPSGDCAFVPMPRASVGAQPGPAVRSEQSRLHAPRVISVGERNEPLKCSRCRLVPLQNGERLAKAVRSRFPRARAQALPRTGPAADANSPRACAMSPSR
jgi:hypothetical protein